MTRLVPGGRGAKYSIDADVVQRESYDERAARLNKRDDWVISTIGVTNHGTNTAAFSANTLYVSYVISPRNGVIVTEARTAFGNATAGATLRAAVYKFSGRGLLTKIVKTDILLDGSSSGLSTATLKDSVELSPDDKLFMGAAPSSAVSTVAATANTTDILRFMTVSVPDAKDPLPTTLSIDSLTKFASGSIPIVHYLSRNASEIL